ncbi:hypothetical protein [Bradyrhizobium manausense]|uniref:hypothetical protein n=1 Tax=Bradyrhizobium manausense TaxID=989370 RepID=UPI000AB7A730|nr:hypothetical protein [Bradyrhizobium manausense]
MPNLLQIAPVAAALMITEAAERKAEAIRSFEWHGLVEYGDTGEFESCYLAKSSHKEPYPILYIAEKADRTLELKVTFGQRGVPIRKRDELLPDNKRPPAFPFALDGPTKESRFLKNASVGVRLYTTTSTSGSNELFSKSYAATLFLSDFSYGIISKEFNYRVFVTIPLPAADPLLSKLATADGLTALVPEPVGSDVSISFRHRSVWLPFANPKSDASEALVALNECVNRHLPPSRDQSDQHKGSSSTSSEH